MREPQVAPATPWPDCRREAWIGCETQVVVSLDRRVESMNVVLQPRIHIRMPGPSLGQERPGVARGQYVKSEWRIAALTGAEPLQVLVKGEGLTACTYRTRSML
jgi:hypothetical protein